MTENQSNLIQNMLSMQAGFNDSLSKDWRTRGIPYVDAIWTEAAEAFDYTQWPWWKRTDTPVDFSQIRMEIVDIWHFLMSEVMTYQLPDPEEGEPVVTYLSTIRLVYENSVEKFKTSSIKVGDIDMLREQLRNIIRCALLPRDEARIILILSAFFATTCVLGLGIDELYKLYVGKNTLNSFRQANGYKKETERYLSIWAAEAGKEDNEYLTDILEGIDITKDVDDVRKEITEKLQKQFDENLALFSGELK